MQTATQSYATNAYTQLHGASSFGIDRKEGSSSKQSADPTNPDRQGDSVKLSVKSKQLAQENDNNVVTAEEKGTDQKPLSREELNVLTELKSRDTEVRAHEQAHLSAAGGHATGGATFSYITGPNGKRYASGGEVPIDTSTEDTPEATILKMRTIRHAALAPANPSAADQAIAAKVSAKETQAMKELQELDTMTGPQYPLPLPPARSLQKTVKTLPKPLLSQKTLATTELLWLLLTKLWPILVPDSIKLLVFNPYATSTLQ